MTTWLEYVAYKLMGPPRYTRGNGESFWECPRCGSYKWHTRPSSPRYKDRFGCYRCSWWGDINDLAEEFASDVTIRLDIWRKEYDVHGEATTIIPDSPGGKIYGGSGRSHHNPPGSSPGGSGSSRHTADPDKVHKAYEGLSQDQRDLLAIAYELADEKEVSLDALAGYCLSWRETIAGFNADHMAHCTDPDCDVDCCRIARGLEPLPPPTPEEIAEWRRQHNEEVQAERERLAEIKARTMAKILADREARRQRNATRNGRVKGR